MHTLKPSPLLSLCFKKNWFLLQDFSETLPRKIRLKVIELSSTLKWFRFIPPQPCSIDNQVRIHPNKLSRFEAHCGSEIQTSLDFEWSKRGWVANGPDFKWDLKTKSPTI